MNAEENIFHLIVIADSQSYGQIGTGAFYISENELRDKYAIPYMSGTNFFLNGFLIKRADVRRLVIVKSTPYGKGGLTLGKKRPDPGNVFDWISLRDRLLDVWDDVTDDFVSGIPEMPVESEGTTQNSHSQRNKVFIVHGRDHVTKTAMSAFLREVGLDIVTWEKAKSLTGIGSPFTLDVVKHGIAEADAVVVLITPDDEGRTRPEFENQVNGSDSDESPLYGQARQNVVYEAGMAFGVKPKSTVIVEFGSVRSLSDLDGVQVIKMGLADEEVKKQQLLNSLRNSGLAFSELGTEWLTAGEFQLDRFTDQEVADNPSTVTLSTSDSVSNVAVKLLKAMYEEKKTDGYIYEETVNRYHEILKKPNLADDVRQGLEIAETDYSWTGPQIALAHSVLSGLRGQRKDSPKHRVLHGEVFRSKLLEAIETIKQGEMIRG